MLALAVFVLLLRRPPLVAASLPILRGALEVCDIAYLGWFGLIGIAAIYYTTFARGYVHGPIIWHAASALVFASILIHGMTAVPLTRLCGRRAGTTPWAVSGPEAQSGVRQLPAAYAETDDR